MCVSQNSRSTLEVGGEAIKDVRETESCLLIIFQIWRKVQMCFCLKVFPTEDVIVTYLQPRKIQMWPEGNHA